MQVSATHFSNILDLASHIKIKFINHFFALSIATFFIVSYRSPQIFRMPSLPKFSAFESELAEQKVLVEPLLPLLFHRVHVPLALSSPLFVSAGLQYSSSMPNTPLMTLGKSKVTPPSDVGFPLQRSSASSMLKPVLSSPPSMHPSVLPLEEAAGLNSAPETFRQGEEFMRVKKIMPILTAIFPGQISGTHAIVTPVLPSLPPLPSVIQQPMSMSSPPSIPPSVLTIDGAEEGHTASEILQENEEFIKLTRIIPLLNTITPFQISETHAIVTPVLPSLPPLPSVIQQPISMPSPPSIPPSVLTIDGAEEGHTASETLQENEEFIKLTRTIPLINTITPFQISETHAIVTPILPSPLPIPPVDPQPMSIPSLPSWHTYKINSKSALLRFWLMKLAPGSQIIPKEIPFRKALVETLLSPKYQSWITDSWDPAEDAEDDDMEMKQRRADFSMDYMRAVDWPKTPYKWLFLTEEEDFHQVNEPAYIYAYEFPLKRGIRAYKDEDFCEYNQ
ncbi:MAG: hypothetical protein H0X26_08495 [Alphaproteobacteria bacterium]|nr:hypothetical protein [Alphaproteobacteria bacterium]